MTPAKITLSVKVLIQDDSGRILALQRSAQSKGNPLKWDLPGGKIDPGEALDEGLRREVTEETGLTVEITSVAGAAQSLFDQRIVAYLILEAHRLNGAVAISDEHAQYAWVSRETLLHLDWAPQFIPFLKTYLASAKT